MNDPMNSKPKSEDKPVSEPTAPTGEELQIKGTEVTEGKNKTGLFQTSPNVKEWLTKSEAEKKGFFWLQEDA